MFRNRTPPVKLRYSRRVTDGLPTRLRKHVEFLCSRPCAGREAGSPEGRAARDYIVHELNNAGWATTIQPVPGCRGANVIATPAGRDPSGPLVLVAAHYDHIGRAMGEDAYWGADDNAAAVAIVLELARQLGSAPERDVMLVAFDGEEPPHFLTDEMGSIRFCAQPPVALDDIAVAIVLDLVGHPVGPADAPASVRHSLFVLGAEKTDGLDEATRAAAATTAGLCPRPLDLDVVPPLSDYEPFRRAGVPVLFLTGGRWRHYHELTDTPEKLDYAKIAATASYAANLSAACDRPLGRYRPERHAWATTAQSMRAVAVELAEVMPQAGKIVAVLSQIAERVSDDGSIAPEDHALLLATLAELEQCLA